MRITRRRFVSGVVGSAAALSLGKAAGAPPGGSMNIEQTAIRYVRFEHRGRASYGILDGRQIRELSGKPWEGRAETGAVRPLESVRLLFPTEPSKILAMAGNYRSHLEDAPAPEHPEVFIKLPSALLDPEGTIVIPPGTKDVHYEGEIVVVIGKRAKGISVADAAAHVLGVTCGNDVSARDWQRDDKQWWRAKASDTFAPVGPCVVSGLDYGDLRLTTRLNGEAKQDARTSQLIFDIPTIVSFISHHITLLPGDLIFTGTPGTTSAMKAGDTVEVEIENIGTLRNRVA